MRNLKFSILFLFFLLLIITSFSQIDTLVIQTEKVYLETDTVIVNRKKLSAKVDSVQMKKHNPKKASWLALIPGAGQIYNKKYWKLPIVYAGLGATAGLTGYYGTLTQMYRKEYLIRVNETGEPRNPKLEQYSDASILELRNLYRRNMEICIGVTAIVYLLSIVDASVDAHLYYFDVSDNLSLSIKPKFDYNYSNGNISPSMALVIKF